MEIIVKGEPKRAKARPTPPRLREELNKQVDDLLAAGVIKPAPDCKWVSPCHLVPKPRSDKWRLVIDYRYMNTLTQDDSYQIPNVSDLLIRLTGAKVFTLIDLNWGFWNVSLDTQSQQYTGFVVPERGVFIWTVMPFGLKISPTVFQRAIEKALRTVLDKGNVSVYIDDIIIYTSTVEENLKCLREVLELLRVGGFFINWAKMKSLQKELLYLGHIVSANVLKPDPAKIKGLVDATPPQDKKALLSFCAAANYLRAYIPKFSELMEPLTRLTGKYVHFSWGQEQEDAYQRIKEELIEATYLTMPKWDQPFILFTDASELAVAAVLTQLAEDDKAFHFIGFASKKLTETQRNWSPTERELYAIVWACEHYEQFLKGTRPLVYSDHKSLEHLTSLSTPKIRRWAIRLSEFNPYVTHIGGDNNSIADWLSRTVPEPDESGLPDSIYVPEVLHAVHTFEDSFTLPKPEEMREQSKLDELELPPGALDWYNDTAYSRLTRKMYVPKMFREQLLLWFHTSRFGGHQGVTRTTNRLRKYVWWPNLQLSVVDFINGCPVCSAIKPLRSTKLGAGALSQPGLFHLISMDFIGPRTYWGKKFWILSIVDHYSRYMVTAVLDSTATPAAEKVVRDHWIGKFGAPLGVLTDRGPEFTSKSFGSFVREYMKSKLYFSSVEYPQGNGINESSHRILETAIRTAAPRVDLTVETIVMEATLLYNVTPNRKIGDTPASLVFGCDLHLPGLEDFEPDKDEAARLSQLRTYRGVKMLVRQLNEIDDISSEVASEGARDFRVGDIVTYRLSTAEKGRVVHFSGEAKYVANRSFPQRVIKVSPNTLVMTPLWTKGKERSAPKEQCKLITTFIPEVMRQEVQQLYPSMPWSAPSEPKGHEPPSEGEVPSSSRDAGPEEETRSESVSPRKRTRM